MAGLVKELLLDYGLNRLSIDQRNDLSSAIQQLLSAGVLKATDIYMLNAYISGYTATEIATMFIVTTDVIEQRLTDICSAIEFASGYTDHSFLQKVRQKYTGIRLPDLRLFLKKHGTTFEGHDFIWS